MHAIDDRNRCLVEFLWRSFVCRDHREMFGKALVYKVIQTRRDADEKRRSGGELEEREDTYVECILPL